jgi:bacteriocin-like protein
MRKDQETINDEELQSVSGGAYEYRIIVPPQWAANAKEGFLNSMASGEKMGLAAEMTAQSIGGVNCHAIAWQIKGSESYATVNGERMATST